MDSTVVVTRRGRAGHAGVWATAACLPVVSHAAALFVNVEPGEWLALPTPLRWALAPDAVLYTAACAIVAAPIAGVAVMAARGAEGGVPAWRATGWQAASALSIAVMLFAATSGLLTLVWSAGRGDAVAFVTQSHVTLIAVGLALAAWGALCAAWWRDPLDAAAVSVVTALIAAGGLLVAGAIVADLPRAVVALGLGASPLVAMASAAHIDIVRMDLLYQISPLAHRQIDYPSWYSATGWYLAIACACFLALTVTLRTRHLASAS